MYMTVSLTIYFFFFNDTATTEIYTLSLHDALPILQEVEPARHGEALWRRRRAVLGVAAASDERADLVAHLPGRRRLDDAPRDRKSTRLNSSHANISYAVFCLKKKKNQLHRRLKHYV